MLSQGMLCFERHVPTAERNRHNQSTPSIAPAPSTCLFLLLVRCTALQLGSTPELLSAVLSLLACIPHLCQYIIQIRNVSLLMSVTYAAVCSPSQSSSLVRILSICIGVRSSSSPRVSRRRGRNRCFCRLHSAFESRSRRPGLCSPCRVR